MAEDLFCRCFKGDGSVIPLRSRALESGEERVGSVCARWLVPGAPSPTPQPRTPRECICPLFPAEMKFRTKAFMDDTRESKGLW